MTSVDEIEIRMKSATGREREKLFSYKHCLIVCLYEYMCVLLMYVNVFVYNVVMVFPLVVLGLVWVWSGLVFWWISFFFSN